MRCEICGASAPEITYNGKIRSGAPGRMTEDDICVYRCNACRVIWHEPITVSQLYESDAYRVSMDETATLPEFYRKHDVDVLDKLIYTGTSIYRGKLFMDIGCGGAGYADFIRGVARHAVLVEPNESFAAQLRERGYEVFAYPDDAIAKYRNSIELLTSYDVIEHVQDPQGFLKAVYDLLAEGGEAFIGTPTEYPVLRGLLGAEFDSFVFSVQHPWVFSRESLELMAGKCGFSKFEVKFYQRFGLGNLLAWMQNRRPCGDIRYDFVSGQLDSLYKSEMAKEGTAEYMVMELRK